MNLSNDEVKHIASLAKIGMTEEELQLIGGQLSQILEQFQSLNTINTEHIETTAHPTSLNTVLRSDKITNDKADVAILADAPKREQDLVRLRPVLQ